MKKNWLWIMMAVCATVLSLFLAWSKLHSQLVFGFDQGRDALEAYSIWHNHNFKIQGPSTDIPGVFHGVAWYYFLAIVYFLTRSAEGAATISFFVLFLSVPLLGFLTQKLFKDLKIASLAVGLYVLSPLFMVFTRWLSNPSLALIITPLLLFYLWSYIQKPTKSRAVFSGLFFGLLIHANFAYAVLLILLPIYHWYFRFKFRLIDLISFGFGLLVTTAPFIVAEFKFSGQLHTGIFTFLAKEGSSMNASALVMQLLDRIVDALHMTIFPWPKLIVILFIPILIVIFPKNKFAAAKKPIMFLTLWLSGFVILQVFSTAVAGSAHILAAFMAPMAIIFAYLFSFNLTPVIILIFAGQIFLQNRWVNLAYSPLSVQQGMFLSDEKKIIDYTYSQSRGKPFILNSITNPLFINTLWAYLYEFYGQPKYGYLPYWGGRDQAGYLGNLPKKPFGEDLRFLIIEQVAGIPEVYVVKSIYDEDKVSDLVGEKTFGAVKVQKRIFHQNKEVPQKPPLLINTSLSLFE